MMQIGDESLFSFFCVKIARMFLGFCLQPSFLLIHEFFYYLSLQFLLCIQYL